MPLTETTGGRALSFGEEVERVLLDGDLLIDHLLDHRGRHVPGPCCGIHPVTLLPYLHILVATIPLPGEANVFRRDWAT